MGWFYGFKLHLVISECGELLSCYLTPGLIAYTWHEKKPSLNIRVKEQFLISN